MIKNQLALIKREIWEHRSIYVTPIAIGGVMALATLTGSVSIGDHGDGVDMAILGLNNMPEAHRAAAITAVLSPLIVLFLLAMAAVSIFYTLDALYAERKDRSILFWRSLPLTDAETVLSKLLTGALAIPLVTLLILYATHLVVLCISSLWIWMKGANALHLIWAPLPLLDIWISSAYVLFSTALWYLPFAGWFLFVSGYVKRSPLLLAFLPIVVLPMIEKIVFRSSYFAEVVFGRLTSLPISKDGRALEEVLDNLKDGDFADAEFNILSYLDIGGFLSSPGLWGGIVVCALFVTAAIYVRRFRDES